MASKGKIENLKPFQPGESGNPNGRPPKLVTHVNAELREAGYEPVKTAQLLDAFQTLINLPLSKIAAIANKDIYYKDIIDGKEQVIYLSEGDNYPMIYRLVAKELIGKRGGEYLEKVLDRAFGKAAQKLDVSSLGESMAPKEIPVTKEQIDRIIDKL